MRLSTADTDSPSRCPSTRDQGHCKLRLRSSSSWSTSQLSGLDAEDFTGVRRVAMVGDVEGAVGADDDRGWLAESPYHGRTGPRPVLRADATGFVRVGGDANEDSGPRLKRA